MESVGGGVCVGFGVLRGWAGVGVRSGGRDLEGVVIVNSVTLCVCVSGFRGVSETNWQPPFIGRGDMKKTQCLPL